MNIQQWIDQKGNAKRYREWLSDPVTQQILEAVANEIRPGALPIGVEHVDKISLILCGEMNGMHHVLYLLKNMDKKEPQERVVVSEYGMLNVLMDSGYSEKDARRIIKEQSHAEGS